MAAKRASHLVRCLRALARDAKASPKVRLKACELLVEVDPTVRENSGPQSPKLVSFGSLEPLMAKMVGCDLPEKLPDTHSAS